MLKHLLQTIRKLVNGAINLTHDERYYVASDSYEAKCLLILIDIQKLLQKHSINEN